MTTPCPHTRQRLAAVGLPECVDCGRAFAGSTSCLALGAEQRSCTRVAGHDGDHGDHAGDWPPAKPDPVDAAVERAQVARRAGTKLLDGSETRPNGAPITPAEVERAVDEAVAGELVPGPKRCENNSPAGYSGHWRDWHRGHGCDRDPNAAPPPAPGTRVPCLVDDCRQLDGHAGPCDTAPSPTPETRARALGFETVCCLLCNTEQRIDDLEACGHGSEWCCRDSLACEARQLAAAPTPAAEPPAPQPAALTAEQVVAQLRSGSARGHALRHMDFDLPQQEAEDAVERYGHEQAGRDYAHAVAAKKRIADLERQLAEAQQQLAAERFRREAAEANLDDAECQLADLRSINAKMCERNVELSDQLIDQRAAGERAYLDLMERGGEQLSEANKRAHDAERGAWENLRLRGEAERRLAEIVAIREEARHAHGMSAIDVVAKLWATVDRHAREALAAAPVEPGADAGVEQESRRRYGTALDHLRSFAEAREPSHFLIREGLSYADVREALEAYDQLRRELEAARAEVGRARARATVYTTALLEIQQATQRISSAALSSLQPSGRGDGGGQHGE